MVVLLRSASPAKRAVPHSPHTLRERPPGNSSVAEGKLGGNAVSSKVRVYEEVLSGAPLNAINVSDIDLTSVPASQIKYTVQDNAGTVTNIVLGDVTGESWIYGYRLWQAR